MIGKIAFWLALCLVVAAALWGPLVSDVEQAKYSVVEKQDSLELRDYAPMLVAQVEVAGEREKAINEGFRLIADFIFGNNAPAQNVAMTAPVIQQKSEAIAMTAPVTQQGEGGKWIVRFVMPSNYTMQNLPKPNNASVNIKEVPAKRFVVHRLAAARLADHAHRLAGID